jgi:GNAT superfamily N-acetyltransferase
MMANSSSSWEAVPADLLSIGTLHARAFHSKSDWHRKLFPLSLAPWWEERYALHIADPACHVLVIRESKPDSKVESELVAESKEAHPSAQPQVLGLVFVRKYTSSERGDPSWNARAPPADLVDPATFSAMVSAMIEYRERFMLGRPHMCVEHFGVDGACQGEGLGSRLMGRVCEMADEEGLDVFVQANEFAESFYHRFGFGTEGSEVMPGGLTECFLVRRARKGK